MALRRSFLNSRFLASSERHASRRCVWANQRALLHDQSVPTSKGRRGSPANSLRRRYQPYEWPQKPKNALIVTRKYDEDATQLALVFSSHLSQHYGIQSFIEPAFASEIPLPTYATLVNATSSVDVPDGWQEHIDLVVCVGGDGTLLHLSTLFPRATPPVVAFNSGAPTFLIPHKLQDYEQVFALIMNNKSCILNRSRLEFKISHEEDDVNADTSNLDASKKWHNLLNEVVLKRTQRLTGVAAIDCFIDDCYLARFKGDGLLLATPTGSTAYSMACGGSIVHPEMDSILLTPINPMTLSSRPLLLPGDSVIRLTCLQDAVYLEGKFGRTIQLGENVTVRRSKYPLPCFSRLNPSHDWVTDLNSRLGYQRQLRSPPPRDLPIARKPSS